MDPVSVPQPALSMWHPCRTYLHLLGGAAARPLLALRAADPGSRKAFGPLYPVALGRVPGVWGDRQGQDESGPNRVRAGRWARPDRGGVIVASGPVRVRAGALGPPERRGRDTKWSKDEP